MCKKVLMAIAVLLAATMGATAQDPWTQNTACPGWNNPSNFGAVFTNDTGGTSNCYSGKTGVRTGGTQPNVLTGTTGLNLTSSLYVGTALANVTCSDCYGSVGLPENDKMFAIMTTSSIGTAAGSQANKDPLTGNNLKFVPTQFNTNDTTGQIINTNLTKSIRIGDGKADTKATALYYELYPTTDNALFVIYYAIVVEAPGHGLANDPTMIIRVMEKTASNSWVQKSDTMAYYITSTPATGYTEDGTHGDAVIVGANEVGWHSNNSYNYKDWAKVVLNLSDCLYQPTRIEVMVSDCGYSAHLAYAYIAGECRPMDIVSSGCPAGMSTTVTKLSAPRGMLEYEWGASNYGIADPTTSLNPGADNEYFTFRTIASGTEADGYADYDVQAEDFQVMLRPNGGTPMVTLDDSVGNWQTFRCNMKSAIDPSKPFWSPLYVNVQNKKPTMKVDSLVLCDGSYTLWNQSYVPGDPTLVVGDASVFSFYNDTAASGTPFKVLTGDSAICYFANTDHRSVVVRTVTTDSTCYSEALYQIHPLKMPNAGFTVSKHVLCDADETTLKDTTADVAYRRWTFLAEGSDTDVVYVTGTGTQNKQLTRPFTHSVEPIELMVRNGMYHLLTNEAGAIVDTEWCESYAYDTVAVFLHPELEVTGDTIVCKGSKTNAEVRAVGVDGCTFEWSTTYGTITGDIPPGNTLMVEPYAEKATYYVKVTSPQGCVAWDSIYAYLVVPQLTMSPADGKICPGSVATLTASDADHYTWTASPADASLAGQDTLSIIQVSPEQTTVYTMVGHGKNDCDALPLQKTVTIVPYPVSKVGVDPQYIDTENPVVRLTDSSSNTVSSLWIFENLDRLEGREVTYTFEHVEGRDSAYVTLTSFNELHCGTDYRFGIPIMLFTAWLPNIFTPNSEDDNARFRLYSINEYEYFHIYIFNRTGQMVFESDDPHFEWDGTRDGEPCPQGGYVYVCNYRKPGTPSLNRKAGAITLIR